MAKCIIRSMNEVGAFGAVKRGNKSNGSNQDLWIFAKTKDVLHIPIFVDEDIPQRAKY